MHPLALLADRILTLVVPRATAQAGDCWTEDWCQRASVGTNLYRRTCCIHSTANETCSPWRGICLDCC